MSNLKPEPFKPRAAPRAVEAVNVPLDTVGRAPARTQPIKPAGENEFAKAIAFVDPVGRGDATLFADIESVFKRQVYTSDANAKIATAYVLFTWSLNSHKHCPRLMWWSATYGEGKTAGWDLTADLVSNPYIAGDVSDAGLARIPALHNHPTICVDEADNWIEKSNGRQMSILNKGFDPKSKAITSINVKADGDDDWTPRQYNVWSPVLMGCCKTNPAGGLARRTIKLVIVRAPHDWEPTPLHPGELDSLKARADAWGKRMPDLSRYPVPKDISPEFRDTWRPLIAVAASFKVDLRPLALARTEESTQENIRLLQDVRTVFGDASELASRELIERLDKLDGAPWGAKWEGMKEKAVEMWLSREIGNFSVDEIRVRPGELVSERRRGYKRAQLEPLWTRYLRPIARLPQPHTTSKPVGRGKGRAENA